MLLDVDLLVAVDHDFVMSSLESSSRAAEAEHVVGENLDEPEAIGPAHRDVLLGDHIVEQLADALTHHLGRYGVRALSKLVDQALMHLAAKGDVGVGVAAILLRPGRAIAPVRFSSVGAARCGSGVGAGRSTSNGRGAGAGAGAAGVAGAGDTPPGRFCQPAGGNRSARRQIHDPATAWVPGTKARLGWTQEWSLRFSLHSVEQRHLSSNHLMLIALQYLPEGWIKHPGMHDQRCNDPVEAASQGL